MCTKEAKEAAKGDNVTLIPLPLFIALEKNNFLILLNMWMTLRYYFL